jgi:hypothetical protein
LWSITHTGLGFGRVLRGAPFFILKQNPPYPLLENNPFVRQWVLYVYNP